MCTFGERLKQLREEKDYTQQFVSEQLELKRSTYCRYENGTLGEPNRTILLKLSSLFGVTIDYLVGRIDVRYRTEEDYLITLYNNLTAEQKHHITNLMKVMVVKE